MKYENIKSIILSMLVLTSLVLTWNLWTYQPNYEQLENTNYVQEVTFGEQKDINNIVKPDTILYHFKDLHTGTTESEEIDLTLQELSKWVISDIHNITDEVKSIPEFVHATGKVELIFPGIVPSESYKQALTIEEEKIPDFNFNRIVINTENSTKEDGVIYFVNYGQSEQERVYEGHIKSADIKRFNNKFYSVARQLNRYKSFEANENRTIFFPENLKKMTSYKYFLNRLDSEKFKEALFSDPSFVQKNYVTNNEEYTDGSSMMTVDHDTRLLSFVNTAGESDSSLNSNELLQKSIDFVNEHGGWTGNFHLASLDEVNQTVIYRLHDNSGYPIFNENGISEIVQVWGGKEIYKYLRPSFDLDVPLRTETSEITLISGNEVVEILKKKKGFQADALVDIVLGYRMSKDLLEPQLINLEPCWYYRYDHNWAQILPEELGGENRGLE